jgi:hypothetical protein
VDGAVRLISQRGSHEAVRRLLDLPLPEAERTAVLESLAIDGDSLGQEAVIEARIAGLETGVLPERPRWFGPPRVTSAVLGRLADAAIRHQATDLRDFAVATLESRADAPSLTILHQLAEEHLTAVPSLASSVERVARRLATSKVLSRLPEDLAALANHLHDRFAIPSDTD